MEKEPPQKKRYNGFLAREGRRRGKGRAGRQAGREGREWKGQEVGGRR